MKILNMVKCKLGIHRFNRCTFVTAEGTRSLTWSRKGKHKKRVVKTNNVHHIEIHCEHCNKTITF